MQVNWKNNIDVTIFRHDAIVIFYDVAVFPLLSFSYSSNMIFGRGVMTIFVYKVLTRNPKIGNTPVWVLPNISRLGQVRDTKFGTNVSNKMLLNAAKWQGYSFYHFRVNMFPKFSCFLWTQYLHLNLCLVKICTH